MIEEQKQLLLKDLCGRLPYGVICHYDCVIPCEGRVIEMSNTKDVLKGIVPMFDGHIGFMVGINKIDALEGNIKPYLRPMSSMTEEEAKELDAIKVKYKVNFPYGCTSMYQENIDYLNSHYFDYRGLIPMDLAFPAPEGMYKTE